MCQLQHSLVLAYDSVAAMQSLSRLTCALLKVAKVHEEKKTAHM